MIHTNVQSNLFESLVKPELHCESLCGKKNTCTEGEKLSGVLLKYNFRINYWSFKYGRTIFYQ